MRVDSIVDLIGNTPLIRLRNLSPPGGAVVYGKAEFMNPCGSVKDRPALAMIEDAERRGALRPGMTIVEPTSGNTGIGLTAVGSVKGYEVILVVNRKDAATGVLKIAEQLGARILDTSTITAAIELATRLQNEEPDRYFVPQQFRNPANPRAHRETTAKEILRDAGPNLRAFVCGVGSGGTFTGVGQALKAHDPSIQIVLAEPNTVPVFSGRGEVTASEIYGIGPPFAPEFFDPSVVDEILPVTEDEATETMVQLARKEALLCGHSSGAFVHVALRVAARFGPEDVVVTVLPDRGERYFMDELFPE